MVNAATPLRVPWLTLSSQPAGIPPKLPSCLQDVGRRVHEVSCHIEGLVTELCHILRRSMCHAVEVDLLTSL